jgi:peroxiredoxin Q/BCP
MAGKSSTRRPKRSVKSGKSKSTKGKGKRVPTKRKAVKKARPKAHVVRKATPSRASKVRPAAKPKPAAKVAARPVTKIARPGASAQAKAPAKGAKSPAILKGKTGAAVTGRGHQGAFEFHSEPGTSSFAEKAPPMPPGMPSRRRSAAKPGSPDWPGESLTVGMMAPEFSLPSTLGRKVSLNEFRGRRVILYFYPKDDTPGCTMEACGFRDNLPRIQSKDAVVLGISLDDELSHQRFAQKYNLPFPLLSDVDAAVSRQYGTYKEKNLYGRSYWGIERTTFVIDREGRVENVFRRVKVEGHAEEVMATLAI